MMTEMPRSQTHFPHWTWFVLPAVALTIVTVALVAWLPYAREQRIVLEVKRIGGEVSHVKNVAPKWLRPYFPVFDRVMGLQLSNSGVSDTDLAQLQGLRNLRWLCLDNTAVTDCGLVHLGECVGLEMLYLSNTEVTDGGLVHLIGLGKLRRLFLTETRVSDQGKELLRSTLPAGCIIL